MLFVVQNCDKINFSEGSVGWLGGRSIWRYGLPLSLWGHSIDMHKNKATDAKKEKNKQTKKKTRKTKEKYRHWQDLQLASEDGISLTCTRLFLDKEVKDKSVKAKGSVCQCVIYYLCVVDFSAASAPWPCFSAAKGPSPGPESAAELCPLSTSPSCW